MGPKCNYITGIEKRNTWSLLATVVMWLTFAKDALAALGPRRESLVDLVRYFTIDSAQDCAAILEDGNL